MFSAVSKARGPKLLIQQLYGTCPRILANTAAVLCNMAEQVVIRNSILAHGAMQALVEPLKSTNPHVLVKTLRCLTVLACEADARAEVGVQASNDFLFVCFFAGYANVT